MAASSATPFLHDSNLVKLRRTNLPEKMTGDLTIEIIEATNVIGADKGGTSSDPYVVVKAEKGKKAEKKKTDVKKKTVNPVWNEKFTFKKVTLHKDHTVKLALFDKDRFSKDDRLGCVRIDNRILMDREGRIEVWSPLVPMKKGEKVRGCLHFAVEFKTDQRPPLPPPPVMNIPPRVSSEPAFNAPPPPVQAPRQENLEIWRIEKGDIAKWDPTQYGKFHTGDSFLILHTLIDTSISQTPIYSIFFWVGKSSTPDEVDTAIAKAALLEQSLAEASSQITQSREVEGHESQKFLSLFPQGIQYLPGGIDSGWRPETSQHYRARLLHIKGTRTATRVWQVDLAASSLNSGDAFILDAGSKLWQWNGKECNPFERRRATDILAGFINERTGKPESFVVEEGEEPEEFWNMLGGKGPIKSAAEAGDDAEATRAEKRHVLLRLSDASGKLEFQEVAKGAAVKIELLKPDDVYILDAGVEIFAWIGRGSSPTERQNALKYAQKYLDEFNRPCYTPITKVMQGGESDYFRQAFSF